jgi:hypothetical protein
MDRGGARCIVQHGSLQIAQPWPDVEVKLVKPRLPDVDMSGFLQREAKTRSPMVQEVASRKWLKFGVV